MTKDLLEWIHKNQIGLDSRDKKLREREYKLSLLVPEQNERLEKLRKGYKALGLVNDAELENLGPITRDIFKMELEQLEKRFKSINKEPKTKEELYQAQNDIEQYISDIMTLTSNRWNTASQYKDLWKKERIEYRQEELNLTDEYNKLAKMDTELSQADWTARADILFAKNKKLIDEQKKRLDGEEYELKDLESLFEIRERLFKIAEQSFLL